MMHYVYILRSTINGKLYKGSTSNLRRRLSMHNSGNVKSTAPYGPWELLYYEAFINKTDALREEKFLKTGMGRQRIIYLLQETIKNLPGGVA